MSITVSGRYFGDIYVSDPSFRKEISRARLPLGQTVNRCMIGKWNVKFVRDKIDATRIHSILLTHESHNDDLEWEQHGLVGVDSGCMAFVDSPFYPSNPYDGFFDEVADLIKTEDGDFIKRQIDGVEVNVGVVTRSGYGDGLYDLYVQRSGRCIVGITVVFITDRHRRQWNALCAAQSECSDGTTVSDVIDG